MNNLFLVEIETKPCTTFRMQYAHDLASVAIEAQNQGFRLRSVRALTTNEGLAMEHSGVKYGFAGVQNTVNT